MARRPLALAGFALVTTAAAVAVWLVALGIPRGRALDVTAMLTFGGVATPPLQPKILGVAHLADPAPLLIGTVLLAGIALLRRRPLMALLVPLIIGAANLTTQLLKPALADVRLIEISGVGTVYPGSWPSGHATAAMSLALGLVLVVGPGLRVPAALLGAAYAITIGYALVALGFHLPSDVLGGYLVAATFTLLGAAALAALEARHPEHARTAPSPPPLPALVAGGGGLLALAGAVALLGAPGVTLNALEHPSALAAGIGIAALGFALTAGLALALRR